MTIKCPGAKLMRQPKPEIFRCPSCGYEVEIWTDEIRVTCRNCKQIITRFQDISCIEWCRLAKDCVGEVQFNKYMYNRVKSVKEKLLQFLEEHFDTDIRRIEHAKKVLKYVEEILKEEGGDSHIVIPAAILHDVGLKETQEGHDKAGSSIARKVLLRHGFQKDHIDEICGIIHHYTPSKVDSINYKIVYDADRLVNLNNDILDKEGKD